MTFPRVLQPKILTARATGCREGGQDEPESFVDSGRTDKGNPRGSRGREERRGQYKGGTGPSQRTFLIKDGSEVRWEEVTGSTDAWKKRPEDS